MAKAEKLRCADCGALTLMGSLRRVPRSNNHCDNVCISCIDAAAAREKAAKRAKDAEESEPCARCNVSYPVSVLKKSFFGNSSHYNYYCEDCVTADPGLTISKENPHIVEKVEKFSGDKYKRGYRGQVFDVYDIIEMWSVTCPALQHAVKKILVPGKRGKNDALADLKEARDALTRAIELQEMREARGHDY